MCGMLPSAERVLATYFAFGLDELLVVTIVGRGCLPLANGAG